VAGRAELLLRRVEREGLQDLRAGVEELLMEFADGLRMFEDDLRGEGTRLDIAALLEFDEVAAVTEDDPLLEPLEDAFPRSASAALSFRPSRPGFSQ